MRNYFTFKLEVSSNSLLFSFYAHPKRWQYLLKHVTCGRGWKKLRMKIRRFI